MLVVGGRRAVKPNRAESRKFMLVGPMKARRWSIPTVLGAMVVGAVALPAHASIIADWTFETSQPVTAGPYSPEIGAGSASGSHAGASTYSTPAGNGSAHSYS